MQTLASWRPMRLDHHVDSDCEGDAKEWFVVASQNRDSEPLERSNYRSLIRIAKEEGIEFHDERRGHWACGWVEVLAVRDEAWARKWLEALRDYPIVCDEDFSELEADEEQKDWDGWRRSSVVRRAVQMAESFCEDGFDFSEWCFAKGLDLNDEADRVRDRIMEHYDSELVKSGDLASETLWQWAQWLGQRPADPRAAVQHGNIFWAARCWPAHWRNPRTVVPAGVAAKHRRK